MKQTEREHESVEKAVTGAGQAGPDKREEGGAARPQSWRQYIEQAEAAETVSYTHLTLPTKA